MELDALSAALEPLFDLVLADAFTAPVVVHLSVKALAELLANARPEPGRPVSVGFLDCSGTFAFEFELAFGLEPADEVPPLLSSFAVALSLTEVGTPLSALAVVALVVVDDPVEVVLVVGPLLAAGLPLAVALADGVTLPLALPLGSAPNAGRAAARPTTTTKAMTRLTVLFMPPEYR